jgi:hypothetical protein
MRTEFLLLSALLASASAAADNALAPSEDERAVLMATRGEASRKPGSTQAANPPATPADLDGAELQAWFDGRFGADPSGPLQIADQAAADIADRDAEAELLQRIERGRRS